MSRNTLKTNAKPPTPTPFGVLVKSNLWTAGGQATLALFAAEVLELEHGGWAALLVFVLSLFVYNLDHVVDTRSQRQKERRAKVPLGVFFTGFSLCVAVLLATALPTKALMVLALPFAVGTLYGLPVIPLPGRGAWRLRDIPLLKTPLVAASVVWCAVMLPMVLDQGIPDVTACFLVGYLFVFAFSNCVTSDLRDVVDDRATRTITIPVLLGEGGSRRLLIGLNVCTLLCLPFWLPPEPAVRLALIAATIGTLAYVVHLRSSSSTRNFALLVDGCPYILLISMLA